jgi:hypothetical protein
MATQDGVRMCSSRLRALLHLNLTGLLFPDQLFVDHIRIGTEIIKDGDAPWEAIVTWMTYSQVAHVYHKRGLLWDTVILQTSDGLLDPLVIPNVWKASARYCVKYLREQLDKQGLRSVFGGAPPERWSAKAPNIAAQTQAGGAT